MEENKDENINNEELNNETPEEITSDVSDLNSDIENLEENTDTSDSNSNVSNLEENTIDSEEKDIFKEIEEENAPETKELSLNNEEIAPKRKKEKPSSTVTVHPVKFQEFEITPPNCTIKKNLDILQDIKMHISVELGKTKSSIREVMELEKGSIVELEKIAGEQVEIYVNEKLVAKGEVIVIEDKFGVRVTSTNLTKGNVNL